MTYMMGVSVCVYVVCVYMYIQPHIYRERREREARIDGARLTTTTFSWPLPAAQCRGV